MYLLELVEPWQNYEGITFYKVKKSKQQETCSQNSDCFKRDPKPKLNPEDELFMALVWLKNTFPLHYFIWVGHSKYQYQLFHASYILGKFSLL